MGIYDKPKKIESWHAFCLLYKITDGLGGSIPVPGFQWFTKKEMTRQRLIYLHRDLTPKS